MGLGERIRMFWAGLVVKDCQKKYSELSKVANLTMEQEILAAEIENDYYDVRKEFYKSKLKITRDAKEKQRISYKIKNTPSPTRALIFQLSEGSAPIKAYK